MLSHTRALVAASVFAFVTRRKVAGLYDHSQGRDLRIAAEARGDRLKGYDGDRKAEFAGMLPEIHDAADDTFISMEIDGTKARGYDRGSSSFYAAQVTDGLVQVFDHEDQTWHAYDVQDADAAQSYLRGDAQG
ncbi:hypothetical protein GR702_12285 [Novosphingobium sp. FGD1]|uniref:Uncharacterized protein n=1 Tax=Novosphingobium silvae TaxID=2692619 RepID=A0A7X4K7U3_9SPHN|nr:hypothetical protein [Novosphingobium silvae]MYL98545.1 hypothetical protein [Novosphingobium silvae]